MFSGQDIPATGMSLGLERIIDVAEELGLLGVAATVSDVLVTIFEPDLTNAALALTAELRHAGLRVETYLEEGRNLGRQFQYANRRGIPFAAVLGPSELQERTVGIKDLASGEQLAVPRANAARNVTGHGCFAARQRCGTPVGQIDDPVSDSSQRTVRAAHWSKTDMLAQACTPSGSIAGVEPDAAHDSSVRRRRPNTRS